MKHPTFPRQISGAPPPHHLNRKRLWLSLLAPPCLVVLLIACFLLIANLDLGLPPSLAMPFIVAVVSGGVIGLILGWVLFIHTIAKRIHGSNLASLILIYLLGQGMIVYGIYFIGFYVLILSSGFFPPASCTYPPDQPLSSTASASSDPSHSPSLSEAPLSPALRSGQ